MKTISLFFSMVLLSMVCTISIALADDIPPSGSIPIGKIVANIYSQGYSAIYEIKYDDDVYKAKVINSFGKEQYLYIDPKTGSVPVPKLDPKGINMNSAISAIPQDRCKTIISIKSKKDVYEVECVRDDNQELKLFVDAISGKILRIRYAD